MKGEGREKQTGGRRVMDCFPERRRVASTLECVKTLYKTPALVSHRVRCGKPNCRCATGEGHGPYTFLLWREGTIQRRRYVRQADVESVRVVVERRQHHDREVRRVLAYSLADLRSIRAWLRELETG